MKKFNDFYEAKREFLEYFTNNHPVPEKIKKEITILENGYYNNPERDALDLKYENMKVSSAKDLLNIPLIKIFYNFLNDEYKDYINKYLKIMPLISNFENANIRSYKTTNCYYDVVNFYKTIKDFATYQYIHFDLIKYTNGEKHFTNSYDEFDCNYVLAVLRSDKGESFLDALHKMIYESDGIKNVSYSLIRGMIKSDNQKSINMVMDLLKAAKLSEGLRQAIVENIDLGTLDTYKMFLEYIRDENLIRFSSVKRSFLTFTGLEYELGDKGIDNLGLYVMECLLDNKIDAYLESDNALKYYIGLYSLACKEFDDATAYIYSHFDNLETYKKSVSIFFLNASKLNVNAKLITKILETDISENDILSVFSNMPNLIFDNENDIRSYIKSYVEKIGPIKKSAKYSTFTNDIKHSYNYYSSQRNYTQLLKLVDRIDDLYEEVYSIFEKHFGTYSTDYVITEIKHPVVRRTLVNGVGSNYEDIRSYSVKKLEELDLKLTKEEYFIVSDFMKSKRSDTRKYVSRLISNADNHTILDIAQSLLNDKNKNKQNGALSILIDNLDKIKNLKEFKPIKEQIAATNFEESQMEYIEILLGKEQKKKKFFFDNKKIFKTPKLVYDKKIVETFLNYSPDLFVELVDEFYNIFESHKGEEVDLFYYDGSKHTEKVGFGLNSISTISRGNIDCKAYENYTFYEEYLKYANTINSLDLVMLEYTSSFMQNYNSSVGRHWDDDDKLLDYYMDNSYIPNQRDLYAKYRSEDSDEQNLFKHKLRNFSSVISLLIDYHKEEKGINPYDEANQLFSNVVGYLIEKENQHLKETSHPDYFYESKEDNNNIKTIFGEFSFYLEKAFSDCTGYFDDNYTYSLLSNVRNLYKNDFYPWSDKIYYRLVESKTMHIDELYQLIFDTTTIGDRIHSKNSHSKGLLRRISNDIIYKRKLSDLELEVYKKSLDYMVEVELDRTEKDTEYTHVLTSLNVFYGAKTFVEAVSKMGKMPFVRGYSWGEGGKKESFSNIIANTKLEDNFTQETFDGLVKKYKVDKIKLLEASMYNLRFIDLTENHLKIKGLKKSAYYFKAHMNEQLTDEEQKIVRRYSDIAFSDFENGQMDLNWFKASYKELGKKNFEMVYKASKYITDGGKHKRAQYFADAVLGKLKIKDVEERINDKRNQEMILAYGLLPLKGKKENAALKRYKRLQLFLKESKEYGAQRRASEALKVSIAMNNLARNFGVDATRFSFLMESKIIETVKKFFEPHIIHVGKETFSFHIDLTDVKNPDFIVIKNDKKLKSIPAKLNKNAYVKEMKEVKKALKDQYKRARNSLEHAMVNEDEFLYQELKEINNHPIIHGILKDLLFICNGFIGFLNDSTLVGLHSTFSLEDDMKLRIVHSVDLVKNDWPFWQKKIVEDEIKQPFKQVFREVYTLTKEELENDGYTNRFAGYQVEGRRMLGIMKSRGWMINDYEGFEKINHKSNLRIDLYSYADWFTPNDVEQPTIEKVVFLDNLTNTTMDMHTLSPVLFSETMRDLDLVVSVAYVGGIDPVFSHTTIEMRKCIIEHNMKLFKIDNYQFDDKHIVIKGTIGNYSIHMGSGIVHMENKGMLPVFPVHSQKRGHLFLPFVDDDPKMSEIITKILMLAKDNEIIDPSILIHLQ